MTKSKNLGLNLPSRDNTTDLADINVISENFETIDNEFENVYNKLNNSGVVNTVSGNPIVLNDSAKAPLQNLKLYGKTTQNGTPTPDAPVPLVSVGDSGSFDVGVYAGNLLDVAEEITVTKAQIFKNYPVFLKANTPYTLSLISSQGLHGDFAFSYTNENNESKHIGYLSGGEANERYGYTFTLPENAIALYLYCGRTDCVIKQCMLNVGTSALPYEPYKAKQTLTLPFNLPSMPNTETKNEVDFGKGVHSEKVKLFTFNGSEDWTLVTLGTRRFVVNGIYAKRGIGVSSHFTQTVETDLCFWVSDASGAFTIYDVNGKWADLNTFKTWLSENKPTFLLELETPIETPLAEAELNAYRQLHTNKPNTTITSEADMEVSYVADTKLYIDNKLAELTALTLEG